MTGIQSAVLDAFVNAPDSMYLRLLWPATGERLTRESFERYRIAGGEVIIFMNTDAMVDAAMSSPLTMVASDAFMADGKGHPRTSGTYSRTLARYVRDQRTVTLMDAMRKMSLAPGRAAGAGGDFVRDRERRAGGGEGGAGAEREAGAGDPGADQGALSGGACAPSSRGASFGSLVTASVGPPRTHRPPCPPRKRP